ncbi:unnamed protein product [Lupinus luteus]|uniref:BLOC-1-related complex subunit 6 C-terminal helix domain-containing protein n=1 Tax=Lupinus luteus TaxID=3873 RepID=A0AAV1YAZ8_LUPLU
MEEREEEEGGDTNRETERRISEIESSGLNESEIVKAIEVVERDSLAIAQSFTSLFASLRLALSNSTTTTLDHLHCFAHATARLQESVLDAATKGNRYINSCLRYTYILLLIICEHLVRYNRHIPTGLDIRYILCYRFVVFNKQCR